MSGSQASLVDTVASNASPSVQIEDSPSHGRTPPGPGHGSVASPRPVRVGNPPSEQAVSSESSPVPTGRRHASECLEKKGTTGMSIRILSTAFVASVLLTISGCPAQTTCTVDADCTSDAYCDAKIGLCFLRTPAFDAGTDRPESNPPSMPNNVSISAGDGEILLAWSPNLEPDVAGYNVYWGRTSALETGVAITLTPNTSFTASGLTNGLEYFFSVEAERTSGQRSPRTAPVSAVPVDLSDCGACNPPSNASPTCNQGVCGFSCLTGFHECGGACVSNSGTFCGNSCTPCPTRANSTATCIDGACGFTCLPGFHECSGTCVPDDSALTCGNACTPCAAPPPDATATCNQGTCGYECNPGYFRCGNSCCNWIEVDIRERHACGITSQGKVKCWGDNAAAQLGNGTTIPSITPTDVLGLGNVDSRAKLSLGTNYSCLLNPSGSVSCWGSNTFGELGNGTNTDSSTPVPVSGLDDALSLATGESHSCVVTQGGGVRCWGANAFGQLGNGNTNNQNTPVSVNGVPGRALEVSVGNGHTCAALETGAVMCWGRNVDGELGTGATSNNSLVPVQVPGLSNVVSVKVGLGFTCALTSAGAVKCWGKNSSGQLGDNTTQDQLRPVDALGLTNATSITTSYSHACAITSAGTALCWGHNGSGQIGVGPQNTTHLIVRPTEVVGLSNLQEIAAGTVSTCARGTGRIQCWGDNEFGQLGNGQLSDSRSPVEVLP